MKYLMLFFLSLMIFSCTDKNELPAGILKPQKMQDVFWDYIQADVYATTYIRKDSSKKSNIENLKLQEKVFKMHHVTQDEFYKSLTYYSNHKDMMTNIIDSMVERKKREDVIQNKKKAVL